MSAYVLMELNALEIHYTLDPMSAYVITYGAIGESSAMDIRADVCLCGDKSLC